MDTINNENQNSNIEIVKENQDLNENKIDKPYSNNQESDNNQNNESLKRDKNEQSSQSSEDKHERERQINRRNKEYVDYVNAKEPKTKYFPSLLWAFLIGGAICAFGQGIFDLAKVISPTMTDLEATSWMLIVIMFITILLTGIGIFDKLGVIAGAGTVIPISGFANSIASPAMEFKKEGIIFGLCVKMFVVAGPVIVSGVVSSVVVGLIYIFF